MEPALEVKDLEVTFIGRRENFEAVRSVSLSIRSGETLGLVGESGSGKSQLSLACLGLTAENGEVSGSVSVCGQEVVGTDKEVIRQIRGQNIAMIFQNPMTALNPFFRIGEQLIDMLRLSREQTREKALGELESAFKDMALPDPEGALRKYPHQFSGGQLQRIMIALALTCRAKVLIADEPTTALDVTTQAQIISLLKRLVEEHQIALLFITHDMGVIAELADRIAVMRRGELVEEGDRSSLLRQPQHEYTRLLLASVPVLGGHSANPPEIKAATEDMRALEKPLLRVNQLCKSYPSRRGVVKALDKVDFRLMKGECTALVGESGSGKTTLAMSLLHLIRPSSGAIYFDGVEISSKQRKKLQAARRNISVVFQNPYSSLNPRMRIFDIVSEPLRVLTDLSGDEIEQRVVKAIESVDLSRNQLSRFPHAFSGGQRQRIALARAFVLEPKLIILDEPTAALDVSVQAQVVELLNELRARTNVAYFFITHDLALVERLANRVLVLYKGEIIERGTVVDVFSNPKHAYTRSLLESVPRFDLPNLKPTES
ncbi:MAG: ABC transporter ATP-binding protein [Verrucomicrobiota bacterium]